MKKNKSSLDPQETPLKKKLVALLLCLHFAVILFNNLPHTALTYKLDDLYLWYMNLTGQYQKGWGMYNTPSHLNERFVISVYDTNDPNKSYSHHNITDSRELYLAEKIRQSPPSRQADLAQGYLKYTKKNMNLTDRHQVILNCFSWQIDPGSGLRSRTTTSWKLHPDSL